MEPVSEGLKRCSTCGLLKPLDMFSRNRKKKDGRNYMCRECAAEYQKKRHKAYRALDDAREEDRDNLSTYIKQHAWKDLRYKGGIEKLQYFDLLAAYGEHRTRAFVTKANYKH